MLGNLPLHGRKPLLPLVFGILLVSCSSDDSSATGSDLESFASFDDLPNCTAKREGEKANVEDEGVAYVCTDGRWTEMAAVYASEDDLPNCSGKRSGEKAYVESTTSTWTCADGFWSEDPDGSPLVIDVVYRDFNSGHSDFENFSEEYMEHSSAILKGGYVGYDVAWAADEDYHLTCGNQVSTTGVALGADGLPKKIDPFLPDYLQDVSTQEVLKYGGCLSDSTSKAERRGFLNATSTTAPICEEKLVNWDNPVYVTPGMVKSFLKFDAGKDGKIDMLDGVHVRKAADLCDNKNFDQWFADVEGVNLRVNSTLELAYDGDSYVFSRTWNNDGFFPLDAIDPATLERTGDAPCNAEIQPNGKCETFGPQSFSTYCPPYAYKWASTQYDFMGASTAGLCSQWLERGGPRATKAAVSLTKKWPADENGVNFAAVHLRNYHYSMMGHLPFTYNAKKGGYLDFASSEDIWVYVDGVLVSDLGGTHIPAPGRVDMALLAQNNHGCHADEPLSAYENCNGAGDGGWADGSTHHIHIFKMSRNTNGADFYIRTNLK